MPTKYARNAHPPWRGHTPYVSQDVPLPRWTRTRLNVVMLVSAGLILMLQFLDPLLEKQTVRSELGTAVVEATASRMDAAGKEVPGLLVRMIAPVEGSKSLFVPMESEFVNRFGPGDRVAVLYVPARGLAPLKILEIGVAPLPVHTPAAVGTETDVETEVEAVDHP